MCVATVADDGALTLRLRMPDCLAERHGKYLLIENVRFAYGHDQVLAALQSNAEYTRLSAASMAKRRRVPQIWVRPSATVSSGMPGAGGCS